MKNLKRLLSVVLAVMMLLAMCTTAFAAASDTGFSDVAADAWYADAVTYVRDNGLMGSTSTADAIFSPNAPTSRAMLVTILYRVSGSPAVSSSAGFTDVASGMWYTDAANWAAANGMIIGDGNGHFGVDDPVTREQIATILWRYTGSPSASGGEDFADETTISSYASEAVDWVRTNGIMTGRPGNLFDPQGNATRAEVAAILSHYMQMSSTVPEPTPDPDPTPEPEPSGSRVLVAYFSGSGNTEAVAQTIADTLDADLFEITPVDPYTDAALNWTVSSSRVNREHEDEALRDIELVSDTVENWEEYDTVFIGYPIWWGIAAWPVNGFVGANDFTGKTVIPFCTSASSGLGQSGELLEEMAGTGNWLEGRRFSERPSQSDVQSWIDGLELDTATNTNTPELQESRVLVTYFSMPETTDPNNMTTEEDNSVVVIDGEVLGNTQYMAYVIQEAANADIFRIEPETPYPTDHETLVDLAAEEQDENARPAIKDHVSNMDDYDVVFIGYPIWWSDMPMIMYSFFDEYDFSGKTIIPFSTHGGSSFAGTPRTIQGLEPNATMLDGLTISRNNIQDARQEIFDWVNDLDI